MIKHKKLNVTPCVGVWIETAELDQSKERQESHPAWVCGLKLVLKYVRVLWIQCVTPCVGVWIETYCIKSFFILIRRHTLRGCVD